MCVAVVFSAACIARLEGQANPPPPATDPATKHIFGIFPNYGTSPCLSPYVPISAKDKFKIASEDAFDPGAIVLARLDGGPRSYSTPIDAFGQEASGYGRYFAPPMEPCDRRLHDGGRLPMLCFIRIQDTFEKAAGSAAARLRYAHEPGILDANGWRRYGVQLFQSAWRLQHCRDFKLVLRASPGRGDLRCWAWRSVGRRDGGQHPQGILAGSIAKIFEKALGATPSPLGDAAFSAELVNHVSK